MPRHLTRERLALLKAIYKDGNPVTPKKAEVVPEVPPAAEKEDPAPVGAPVVIDTAPLEAIVGKLAILVQNHMADHLKMVPAPPPRHRHEEWIFDIHRDRYGKIDRVTATTKE